MRTIVVDDHFPYDPERMDWAFTKPNQTKQIWPLILEKCWAKVFGSYQSIEEGYSGEVFYPFANNPSTTIRHKEINMYDYHWA